MACTQKSVARTVKQDTTACIHSISQIEHGVLNVNNVVEELRVLS